MKKRYSAPVTDIEIAEPIDVICSSMKVQVTKGAEWGAADGEYSPGEWINENHVGSDIGSFNVVTADEDADWKSRSNVGIFD